jgi:phage shock protein PspC (stress-responsive transcriptional regulator)
MVRGVLVGDPVGMGVLQSGRGVNSRLERPETDRVIAGVAGGVAQRFGLSSTLVRVAWVVSVVLGGFGLLAYVILWIALPSGGAHIPATRIAEERYARGEISAAELNRIRSDLTAAT